MARDPDAQMVVFKDTRGRRTTSQKIRDWGHIFKSALTAGRAAEEATRAVAEVALYATIAYTSRPKLYVYVSNLAMSSAATIVLRKPGTVDTLPVVPSYLSRVVDRIDLGHPDLPIAEGMGLLAVISGISSNNLFGFVTDFAGAALYHALLNGFDITVPVTLKAPGLFSSRTWTRWDMQVELQAKIDAGTMAFPDRTQLKLYTDPGAPAGTYVLPVEPIIFPAYLPRYLYALGHAGFVSFLLRHGALGSGSDPT